MSPEPQMRGAARGRGPPRPAASSTRTAPRPPRAGARCTRCRRPRARPRPRRPRRRTAAAAPPAGRGARRRSAARRRPPPPPRRPAPRCSPARRAPRRATRSLRASPPRPTAASSACRYGSTHAHTLPHPCAPRSAPLTRRRGRAALPQSGERAELAALVSALEAHSPLSAPTASLSAVAGDWRLLYTTVTIRGPKRTKLGLRGMVSLGAFTQRIDVDAARAVNTVGFALAGGALLTGELTINAAFAVASPTRCVLTWQQQRGREGPTVGSSACRTATHRNAQRGHYVPGLGAAAGAAAGAVRGAAAAAAGDLQPAGLVRKTHPQRCALRCRALMRAPRARRRCRLELTYVDAALRVGRDSRGDLFVLERVADAA
jgi:hypothetical protein